jgi:peptidoglycan/xylan/chitin deacetylase (PgdA/CDA1 family)
MSDEPFDDVLVLCYHGVSDSWPAATAIRPRQLEEQLKALIDLGYRGATFTEALIAPPAPKTVAITFDDAHRSVLELAAPAMAALGVPGTMFVATDFPDSGRPLRWDGIDNWIGGPHEHELACMSWSELGQLRDAGWEIGSHTCSHPHLTQIGPEQLEAELRVSREVVSDRLGIDCLTIAYPYGDCDDRVASAAWAAGYRLAATVPRHYATPLPMQWPRIAVDLQDTPARFRFRTAASTRRIGVSPTLRPLLGAGRTAKRLGRSLRPGS